MFINLRPTITDNITVRVCLRKQFKQKYEEYKKVVHVERMIFKNFEGDGTTYTNIYSQILDGSMQKQFQ
ncbi:hypothetical protein HDU92_006607 [Lobulomyces angularis]|nr:hypothetical protein HDU92_006607 [Lobulomyces angularis]